MPKEFGQAEISDGPEDSDEPKDSDENETLSIEILPGSFARRITVHRIILDNILKYTT